MDNQHKKIKGYRDLSQAEIDLMNEIKAKAEEVSELIDSLSEVRRVQALCYDTAGLSKEQIGESRRASAIAKTKLQTGFMWLVRAVALPNSF